MRSLLFADFPESLLQVFPEPVCCRQNYQVADSIPKARKHNCRAVNLLLIKFYEKALNQINQSNFSSLILYEILCNNQ